MKTYSVTDIATLLDVGKETVRRWIRSGCLKSTIASKKNGHVINERDLFVFVRMKPKYRARLDSLHTGIDIMYRREELNTLLHKLITEREELNKQIYEIESTLEGLS